MSIVQKLEDFLREKNVPYDHLPHHRANTAVTAALAERVPLHQEAKVVMVKANDQDVMVVLPGYRHLSYLKLESALGAGKVRLAFEDELYDMFEGCEVGAMPPFGNLYGIPVWADTELAKERAIVFNAGTHRDAVRMLYEDWARIVNPQVADLGYDAL